MTEVEISRIIIDEKKSEQVIILKEKSGQRLLPMVVGPAEVSAIKMTLSEFIPPRPFTHDLLSSIIKELDFKLDKVIIDELIEGTFHAKLYLKNRDKSKIIDARPSDSIALALRTKSPIFVKEHIMEKIS